MSCRGLNEVANKIPKGVPLRGARRRFYLNAQRAGGCVRVLSWSRRSFVQEFVRQVGWGVDIAQCRDDFLTHKPNRAH